jgi:carboxypeptidase Q
MFRQKNIVLIIFAALLSPAATLGQMPAPAPDAIAKIKDEGMNRSQAMATIRYLTDVIGPRLTNSPGQRRANQWTKQQLEKWGLKNAMVDPWGEFGRGWELKRFSAMVTAGEQTTAFRAYPKAWSPSTNGPVTSDVIYYDATDDASLEKFKGRLKGAIVLTAPERAVSDIFKPTASRQSDADLAKLEDAKPAPPPQPQPSPDEKQKAAQEFNYRKAKLLFDEGAAVLIDSGFGVDAGTIRVMGASLPPNPPGTPPNFSLRVASKNAPATIPQLVAEVEQYNRLVRLIKQGVPVKMTVDLQAQFYDDDLKGYNTIAEIPGTDPALKDEVVMVGAHLDSWHSGTGATDNGAGTTVAMEALRIIQAAGLQPRRTIRIGLWTGEEQGLLGSRGYVAKTLGTIGDGSDADAFKAFGGQKVPITKKPAHDRFASYYNLDNGTGQIRGIYLQGNEQLRATFKDWLTSFKDWNATTVTINNTGGTDHLSFDALGLPGFQFIQDPIEYFSRSWHTTQDVSDRILEEDLKRSAVIMAAFAYQTAMMDERLPRKDSAAALSASVLPGFDFRKELDEIAFRNSGLGFSVCGHEIDPHEIKGNFPAILAVNPASHVHAE